MKPASTGKVLSGAGLALLFACSDPLPPTPVASIEVTPHVAGVATGHTLQLTATLRDADGNELRGRAVTWTSSNDALATVSGTGLVTGLALSDVVWITATSEDQSDIATLAVVPDLAGEWNFTEQFDGRHQGRPIACSDTGSYQFTQNGADIGGTTAQVGTCVGLRTSLDNTQWPTPIADGQLSSTHLAFHVGPGCVYEANVTGLPSAKLSGTVACAYFQDTTSGTWEAVPGGAPVASVAVRWDVQAVVGGVVQLVAVPRDGAGHVLSRAVTWSNDNSSVATVSDNGLVFVRAAGSARITATSEGTSGSAGVTADLVSFSTVSAGVHHSCGVTTTGAAYCWGWGGTGQLGTGFRTPGRAPRASLQTPLAVVGGHSFTTVTAGYGWSCGVTTTGDAYCWGDNTYGQLGDGSTNASLVPVLVAGGQQFVSVSAGAYHSCGVTTANAVYCWGGNNSGQLGDGSFTSSSSPVRVAGDLVFQAVRSGSYHNCGVTTSNEAYCWGYNLAGQLGTGTTDFAIAAPEPVAGGHTFVAAAGGYEHSCAISSAGAAYCWGEGEFLGDGLGQGQTLPVPVAGGLSFATSGRSLATGQEHTCASRPDGAVYCWGHNYVGQVGDGSTTARGTPALVSGGLRFASISVGIWHTCGVTVDAVAYCWGVNSTGQIGATTAQSCRYSGLSVPCATTPFRVAGTVQPGADDLARLDARVQTGGPLLLLPMMLGPAPPRR